LAVAAGRALHARTGAFQEDQQAAGFVPEDFPGAGQMQVPLSDLDQGRAQIRFHFADRPGKRRGFDVIPGCRPTIVIRKKRLKS
jgi:hypothetical protein